MKKNNPSSYSPKKHYLILLISMCFAIVLIMYTITNNTFSVFTPTTYNSANSIDDLYNNNTRYVNCHADTLYYSGYDCTKGTKVYGYYYYSLDKNRCTIYLLSKDFVNASDSNSQAPATLQNVSFKAHLTNNDSNLKSLLEYMSTDLNWNYYGISKCASNIVIDQTDSSISSAILILLLFCAVVLFNCYIIFLIIYHKRLAYRKNNPVRYNNASLSKRRKQQTRTKKAQKRNRP